MSNSGKSNDPKLDRVILQASNIEIKSIVVEDEFGEYLDLSLDEFRNLKLSEFDPCPGGSSEGSAQDLRDDWPHAIRYY